ncbi:CPCC family cysteine-rich protein [Paludisphaera borealis]|uniref:CPCC family cysteine-rich protein n=1 Tax=Paludisphaera borealis TaxID=1387353 RepID=UPI00097084B2
MPHPCPACGFEVFDEPSGCYEICPVCGWEDDPVQLRFPAMQGGANRESLFELQKEVLQKLPLHIVVHDGFHRCVDWRPLNQEEARNTGGTPTTGKGYFDAVDAEESKYCWQIMGGRGI